MPSLTTWPRKRAPPKHYKNRGFSLFKKSYVSRNGHFWTKKTQIQKFQLSFLVFFLFQQHKTLKLAETSFLQCFNKPKKENFQILNLKHRKLKKKKKKNNFCTLLLIKENNWAQKKHKMIIVCAKNRLKPLFIIGSKKTWPR